VDPRDTRGWVGRAGAPADQVTPAPIAALAMYATATLA